MAHDHLLPVLIADEIPDGRAVLVLPSSTARVCGSEYELAPGGHRAGAVAHCRAAVDTLEGVVRDRPDDVNAIQNLAVALTSRADVVRYDGKAGTAAALAATERAAELIDRGLALDPANALLPTNAVYVRSRLGYTHLSGRYDPAAAVPHFRAALRVAGRHAQLPTDPLWGRYHRVALLDLASRLQRLGEQAEAERLCLEALPLLAAADPDNGLVQRDHAVGLSHLSWVRVSQERWADAERLLLQANEILEKVAGRTGSSALVAQDIPSNWNLLHLLSQRQGRYAEAADRLERWLVELKRPAASAGLSPDVVAAVSAAVSAAVPPTAAAFRLMPKAATESGSVPAQPAAVAKWLAVCVALELAWRGDPPAAHKPLGHLAARYPTDPDVLFQRAVVCGRLARRAADPAERERLVRDGADALLAGARANPSCLGGMHLFPDLDPVRAHPDFRPRLQALLDGR